MAALYWLREVSEVGIGNTMFYQTEPHYANKANRVGMLSLNCVCTYNDGRASEYIVVKCIDVHPVLKCTTKIPASRLSMSEMKKSINSFVTSQFAASRANGVAPLNDSRYILDVTLNNSPVAVAENKYWNEPAISSSIVDTTNISLVFNRVEDADAVMRGCRAFLKKCSNGVGDPAVKFPPPEYPMWVRLHEATPDNVLYKKYRDSYEGWEVCDIFCTQQGWHYSSHLCIDANKILHSAKMCADGAWCKVVYVDFRACQHIDTKHGHLMYQKPVFAASMAKNGDEG